MNILLVYPKYPDTYWSFKHALRFISKKAAVPPLGLITVSAMLPRSWNKKLIDMNVTSLKKSDLIWADYVFISAMYIQKDSVDKIIDECNNLKVKIVAGGPLFTQEYNNYPQIDHFVLNEAEITLPPFLKAVELGETPQKVYNTDNYADITLTPVPDYYLLNMKAYALMNLQFSRGCPFACDFCEITSLLGHQVRMKKPDQIINEMETIYNLGWRGSVSIVDDNFIGNKREVKTNLLPKMRTWMQKHKYPFVFNVQTSINLADEQEILSLMSETGFNSTFIGIETPVEESLQNCNKIQNKNRDLIQNIRKIQQAGMQVSGGFIVGFDSDSPDVFQKQIDFIQQSGIVSAMVGLLNAPKNTKLYKHLQDENRLTTDASGNNTDFSMNFKPKMDKTLLLEGYRKIICDIYSVKPYYKRIRQSLKYYNQSKAGHTGIAFPYLMAFIKSVFILGIFRKGRLEYWKLMLWTLLKRPGLIVDAITFAIYGYHFRAVYRLQKNK